MKEFLWTNHAVGKMKQYGLSEQKVRGVVFRPNRKEEGIAPKTIAVMQKAGSKKRPYEVWVMYQTIQNQESPLEPSTEGQTGQAGSKNQEVRIKNKVLTAQQKKIISAWKYPGVSPKKNPIPEAILRELEQINE